jgi:alpha-1,2-mannosyltransferase
VLWAAVRAVQTAWPGAEVWVYADDEGGSLSPDRLAAAAESAFGLPPRRPVRPIPLPAARAALDPGSHPRFTLITQSLAGARLAAAALAPSRSSPGPPALWIDTAGWAAAYPAAAAAGCAVAAYVHYPLVSTDMLRRLKPGHEGSASPRAVRAVHAVRAVLKAGYYYAVASLYGCAAGWGSAASGSGANAVMANSSWTAGHVRSLWWRRGPPALVHPPCGAADLAALPLERTVSARVGGGANSRPLLVCVAQFRPEKDQALVLRAYAAARASAAARAASGRRASPGAAAVLASRLLFLGSVRPGGPDEARVVALRRLAAQLGLLDGDGEDAPPPARRQKGGSAAAAVAADARSPTSDPDAPPTADPAALLSAWTRPSAPPVAFIVGAPRPVLHAALGAASAGLHAMVDEHFGISVVEYMAAGAIPIAHRSGGPASDIVLDEQDGPTGFLCASEGEYAAAMTAVLGLSGAERDAMAGRARARAARFSDAAFDAKFVGALAPAAVAAGLGPPVGDGGVDGGRRRRAKRA